MTLLTRARLLHAAAVLAFLLAFGGTAALARPAGRPWGFAAILLGAVLGALVLDAPRPLLSVAPRWRPSRPGIAGLALAAALLLWADARRIGDAAPRFGATEALWALSMALLALSSGCSPDASRSANLPAGWSWRCWPRS